MGDQVRVRVTFVPGGTSVEVEPGSTVLAAASRAGLVIPAPCGGRGACGRCAISVEAGELESPSAEELRALSRARTEPSRIRLACLARVAGPVSVRARVLSGGRVDGGVRRVAVRRRVVGAVDLGTTTVSAAVLDPSSGQRLGKATVGNRQAIHGADILSRISAALEGRGAEMREAAEASLIEAIELSCEDAGIAVTGFEHIVVAANTAMLSLLVGVDVSGLAAHPFSHAIPELPLGNTAFVQAFPGAQVLAIPPVGAFVGGDLTAGLIAEGLVEGASGVAYLDIGTNAEIAVLDSGDIHLASAPAGPAFEGWGISCGGSADESGIVRMEADVDGGWKPVTPGGSATHLTGSGLLSAVAELRRFGHVDRDGRLTVEGPLEESFFILPDGVRAIWLGGAGGGVGGVYLSQLDIRAFQYAKAAVCVALRSCCDAAGVTGADLNEYIIAGSFGGALAEADLVDVGVVPHEAAGRLRYAGEAALSGALAVALEPDLLETAKRLSASARLVDLAADESFSERFIAQMRLEAYSL